jgi:hypothetical protein
MLTDNEDNKATAKHIFKCYKNAKIVQETWPLSLQKLAICWLKIILIDIPQILHIETVPKYTPRLLPSRSF